MINNKKKQLEAANKPLLRSIQDTSEELGIGRTKTYELIARGDLTTCKIGSRRLVTMESIEALVARAMGDVT